MTEPDLIVTLTQFGVAGLIGWMWLLERRAGTSREQQLTEAHKRLMEDREQVAVLMEVVRDNTRALAALEAGQRGIAAALERLGAALAARGSDTPNA